MSILIHALTEMIENPLGDYRSEEDIDLVLRRRLTKKEYKVLLAEIRGEPDRESLMEKLNLDEKRRADLWENTMKKINSDRIKKELFQI